MTLRGDSLDNYETVRGDSLDNYETVRGDIEDLNQRMAKMTLRHPPTGLRMQMPPIRLFDNEIIRRALGLAAAKIREDAGKAR